MYYTAFGWNVLEMSIKSIRSNMLFKSSVFSSIFCLNALSTDESVVLKSPTIIVLLSISPFKFVNIYFIYLSAHIGGE